MTSNELRIGNYYDHNGEIKQVTPSVIDEVFATKRSWYKPIPLTEEILLKCGFIRHHNDYYNTRIYIKNVIDNIEFEWGCFPIELGSGLIVTNIKLKYLHQLQNLYFALTNEELKIIL
jgi:hypothetical protein